MRQIKRWMPVVWLAVATAGIGAVQPGDAMDQVRARHGAPMGQMSSGNRATWLYPGFTVVFLEGRVEQGAGPVGAETPRADRVREPTPATPSPAPASTPPPVIRDRADGFRWETIFIAVDEDDLEEVRKHLAAGENVNVRDPDAGGETPLHLAAGWAGTRMLELLLDEGADIHARAIVEDEIADATPLHVAILENKSANARLLIQRGADVHAGAGIYDPEGLGGGRDITPLHMAASEGRADLVGMLLDAGARVDATMSTWLTDGSFQLYNATPLHMAAIEGQTNVMRLLIERGANVNARTRDGKKPLAWAELVEQRDAVRLLRMHGGTQ